MCISFIYIYLADLSCIASLYTKRGGEEARRHKESSVKRLPLTTVFCACSSYNSKAFTLPQQTLGYIHGIYMVDVYAYICQRVENRTCKTALFVMIS